MKQSNYKLQVIFDSREKPIKFEMRRAQKYLPNNLLQPKISPRKSDKVIYNQKMVNDYVEIINQRLGSSEQEPNRCSFKMHSVQKSISSQLQVSRESQSIEKLYNKSNNDNYQINHRKSLTKEDKLYLLSDPLQEMLKTRQSITDLRAIELDGDEFTQQYKNKINEEYEREIFKKDMIQRRIFDSQLKYQGKDSIKQFIFQQNMKVSQKFHTEPIDRNIHNIKEFVDDDKTKTPKMINKYQVKNLRFAGIKSFQENENSNFSSQRFEDLFETCDNFNKDSKQIKNKIMRLKKQTWRKYKKILQIGVSQKEIKID